VIDHKVFAAEMKLLQERFNKQMSDPVFARYFEFLSAHLSTAEFQQAAIAIFNEERFFPAPVDFVNRLRGDVESQANRAWARLLRAIQTGTRAYFEGAEKQALEEIGGRWAVEHCASDRDLGFKQREFIKAFKGISEPPLALKDSQRPELPSTRQAEALVSDLFAAVEDDDSDFGDIEAADD
jgi:hypothetical protein